MNNDTKKIRTDCQADAIAASLEADPPERAIVCQADTFESGSTPMSRPVDLARRTQEYIRRHGWMAMAKKAFRFLSGGKGDLQSGTSLTPFAAVEEAPNGKKKARPEEVLSLQAGECIEVKSEEEILKTLDENGKLNGLTYIPAMRDFCGKRFKVFKRMETMYQEESGKVRRLKHTVLLDGVHCDGMLMRCDRACFFFWREAWLRRVDSLKPDPVEVNKTLRTNLVTISMPSKSGVTDARNLIQTVF